MFVEDEALIRNLTQKILLRKGCHVLVANEPRDAFKICEQHKAPIHLLVTDVVMPEISGTVLADDYNLYARR